MSELHRTDVVDGSLLEISCGVLELVEHFDRLVARYGTATNADDVTGHALDLVLGLLAVRDGLMDALERTPTPLPSEQREPRRTDWLR